MYKGFAVELMTTETSDVYEFIKFKIFIIKNNKYKFFNSFLQRYEELEDY